MLSSTWDSCDNALENAQIRKTFPGDIPFDTLSQIFQNAVFSPLTGLETGPWLGPLILGSVCSAWRQAAWRIPQLWSNINVRGSQSNTTPMALLLQLYFKNSGALPLALSIEFTCDPNPISFDGFEAPLVHPFVDPLIIQNLRRVKELHLQYPPFPYSWLYPSPQCHQTQSLEPKSLTDQDDAHPSTLLSDISLPWQSLTILKLTGISLDVCVQFLLQCTNLVTYNMDDPLPAIIDNPDPTMLEGSNNITMHELEEFSWVCTGKPWDEILLRQFRAPKLDRLSWRDATEEFLGPREPFVVSFFRLLPVNLSRISISFKREITILPYLPPLHKFKFLTLDCENLTGLINSLIWFSPGRMDGGVSPMVAFPELEEFTIGSLAPHRWRTCNSSNPVMKLLSFILEMRLNHGGRTFVVNFRNLRFIWEPESPESQIFSRLFADRKLVIKENGVVPQWCEEILGGTL